MQILSIDWENSWSGWPETIGEKWKKRRICYFDELVIACFFLRLNLALDFLLPFDLPGVHERRISLNVLIDHGATVRWEELRMECATKNFFLRFLIRQLSDLLFSVVSPPLISRMEFIACFSFYQTQTIHQRKLINGRSIDSTPVNNKKMFQIQWMCVYS